MTCQKLFHGRLGNSMVTLHCSFLATELPRTKGSTLFVIFPLFVITKHGATLMDSELKQLKEKSFTEEVLFEDT